MEHINKIELKGTIGNIRVSEVGESLVSNFSLVTNIMLPSKNTQVETTWHNIVAWGGSIPAETITKLAKGQTAFVSGRIRSRAYTTSSGEERTIYEVLARSIEILPDQS
ncbi:MAG: single-stranded DNA-binding protein [Bacteroidales bacterium]|nr:single-stranded DNA-binding protein [Bacteroidales bacterium]